MLRIPIDQEIKLAHDTLLKAKGIRCRIQGRKGKYTISGLTKDEIGCIWRALSVFEGILKDDKEKAKGL